MVDAWSANDESVAAGSQRRGYMGHVTKICNDIVSSSQKGPYSVLLSALVTGQTYYMLKTNHFILRFPSISNLCIMSRLCSLFVDWKLIGVIGGFNLQHVTVTNYAMQCNAMLFDVAQYLCISQILDTIICPWFIQLVF